MRLATLRDGSPDGALVVVSGDGERMLPAGSNLLGAIEWWDEWAPRLAELAAEVERSGEPLDQTRLAAPLPRSWQWLDGSAFETHGRLMQVAFGLDPVPTDRPLMYQGVSDRFYGPFDDIPFPDSSLGIDFEGEYGVIVDRVPMGVSPDEAARHIRLLVQINDWSLRTLAPIEMRTGFGWIQAKPPCSVAPFAVTPDELGEGWADGRVALPLEIEWNGCRFGAANGAEMLFSFPQLVAHAARTRELVAGTIIGSGTVSNAAYAEVGSSCISEVRAAEIIAAGAPQTPFMAHGDRVRMEARASDGRSPFGVIQQRVVVTAAS
ncbi:FAA hydrolase family protein [Sphingomonas ginkgonis]|uniref:FAA hydrolase family protein n=1 Tax=Sphingomonas ginkgonis TaxID=2315330 RepID=A0A3R9YLU0_9SPHN|nr:fumarylacetoacetate hydrolase family protein [Sphingomonas ginkgonis]RST30651.1 FAA hydrolase family protein [Sphingomonas ginkgonis]